MCEVLRSNFETFFPLIEKAIKQAEFIGNDYLNIAATSLWITRFFFSLTLDIRRLYLGVVYHTQLVHTTDAFINNILKLLKIMLQLFVASSPDRFTNPASI